jgi:hypothetical protein
VGQSLQEAILNLFGAKNREDVGMSLLGLLRFGSRNSFTQSLVHMLAVLAVLVGLSANRASAQAISSVTGVVTDPSGSVVVDADVKLTNPSTAYSASATTNSVGVYVFTQIPAGPGYEVTVSKSSFRTFTVSNLTLGAGIHETRDVALQLGDTKTTVEVQATGEATLNTTDASISSVLDSKKVEELPSLFVNNAANLLALSPGVTTADIGDDARNGSVTGTRGDQTNITLDGLDVNDQRNNQAFAPVVGTPIDSIEEVKTTVGGADASYGRSGGAQVELATKSGTNQFHGDAYEFNRNTDFAANDYFNNLNGIPRPALIRNQFGGSIGGPIVKNKAYFFFNYNGLRQNSNQQILDVVPINQDGSVNYITATDAAGNPCPGSATLLTNPGCIKNLPATSTTGQSVQSIDPAGIGADTILLNTLQSRPYPKPNDFSAGDGVNTAGFRFVEPAKQKDNIYLARFDYQLTPKQRLFARGTWDRSNDDDSVNTVIAQFPGDPVPLGSIISHSRSFVIGHTWTASSTLTNQLAFGISRQLLAFPRNFAPTAPNLFSFSSTFLGLTAPFGPFQGQFPNTSTTQARDVLNKISGKHNYQFGGSVTPIRFRSGNDSSINFLSVGQGGGLQTLGAEFDKAGNPNPLRPNDILNNPTALNNWDGFFPFILGRYAQLQTSYNYDSHGQPFPLGNRSIRNFHSNQYEVFAQDSYNVTSSLTITYGLRWYYHDPLVEANGFESTPSIYEGQYFATRVNDALSGIGGFGATPLVSFSPAGPANNAPNYYKPNLLDFAPHVGIAYSPAFTDGLLGRIFGNRKSSIRAGAGMSYDNQLVGQGFLVDLQSFIFTNTLVQSFGGTSPANALATNPRFAGFAPANVPAPLPPGRITTPFTPNLDANGVPIGFALLQGFPQFFTLNNNLHDPYEINASLDIQRELPGDFLVDVGYFGKFGRRLVAVGDAAQTLNFRDPASGQLLYSAFGALQKQLQAGTGLANLTSQPWFENQINAGIGLNAPGLTCETAFGLNCTQVAAAVASNVIATGDVSSTILFLDAVGAGIFGSESGFLLPNVGLPAQTGANGYVGNFSSSNYNALIFQVKKRLSHSFTLDVNYAYSHSIDNASDVQNQLFNFAATGAALVCDLRNLRVCRASSNFDATHNITSDFIYQLPLGRGQRFLGGSNRLLDAAVGGWSVSGIVTHHTGFPFQSDTGTFPIDFTQSAPGVFVGKGSDIAKHIHQENGVVQFFSSQANALGAFAFPFGGATGDRNDLRAPALTNVDLSILKNFTLPWSDRQSLQLRGEAFNLFNHENFGAPSANINTNSGAFGQITSSAVRNSYRQLQVAIKYSF